MALFPVFVRPHFSNSDLSSLWLRFSSSLPFRAVQSCSSLVTFPEILDRIKAEAAWPSG